MDMQVYVTGSLEFPIGDTYNFHSYDASEGHPLPKLGEIIIIAYTEKYHKRRLY